MIKRREKTKREDLRLGIEIFEKRFQAKDFNGQLLSEFSNIAAKSARYVYNISEMPQVRGSILLSLLLVPHCQYYSLFF